MDRVMVYRFEPDFSGNVIAEDCEPGMEPFLGLRYPASDIPENVRRVMLRNPYRIIQSIHDPHSEILAPADGTAFAQWPCLCRAVAFSRRRC